MSTCFFIGHRETPNTLLDKLSAEVERHITEYGVTDFVVGRYGRFDTLAAKCVKAAKKRHPAIVRANQYMVENSDYLIAYVWHSASNAWDLVEYARKYEKQGHVAITTLPKSEANWI